mmetsp:Transcript_10929/g.40739  ORF Transcript_10929/g.40739 Transcript_10929/m.40739 type:complete len:1124 (-) Transcript_10929:289-3660(-)|eukprot:CAMPEP_0117438386 /NCGR_PEP_ID=MMETSP0759-20121206/2026_1 /TAXON_ID=63605 /ORGANISM="Percolomonas cosmopolitus, Strain WS" /LENGTH=1123 /DNA_ID=CAMNT_0005230075 /DNA_START=549 /DNA_END=3917 /DNA_ORIENTATION=-
MGEIRRNTLPFLIGLRFAYHYILHDHKTHLKAFGIGFTVVVTIVFIIAVMYNAVQQSPYIFLKLSEDNAGESDMYINARMSSTSQNPFVNVTDLNANMYPQLTSHVSPRWILPGGIISHPDTPHLSVPCVILAIDTQREHEMGIARHSQVRTLGPREIHAKGYLLRSIGVKPNLGQRAKLGLNMGSLLNSLKEQFPISAGAGEDYFVTLSNYEAIQQLLILAGIDLNQPVSVNVSRVALDLFNLVGKELNLPPVDQARSDQVVNFTVSDVLDIVTGNGTVFDDLSEEFAVVDSMESSEGYYPPQLGNVVIVDSKYIMDLVHDYLVMKLKTDVIDVTGIVERTIDSIDINDFAVLGVAQFDNRFAFYKSDSKARSRSMIQMSNDVFQRIGVDYPINLETPVLSAMSAIEYVSLFVEQIFFAVVTILSLLGCLVIFSLLFSQTEEKTYEYGMMRALGMNAVQMVEIIIGSSLFFAIPAILVALILAFLINLLAQQVIDKFVVLDHVDPHLHTWALLIPIILGLFIPLISNFLPIRYALSRTLRDSLDVTHQSNRDTTVSMVKLQNVGLEPWQTVVALLLVTFGFIVYYIVPFAFTSDDMSLFFTVLNVILLGMLIGLCITAVVLEHVLEKILVHLFLWGSERRLLGLIFKNMSGHRQRSKKTFLMFTVCIAFIIFVSVVFALQISTVVATVEQSTGADIVIQSDTRYYSLPEEELVRYLSSPRGTSRLVDEYAFITFPIHSSNNRVTFSIISNLSFFPRKNVEVYGLSRNYLQATHAEYLQVSEYDDTLTYKRTRGTLDVIDSLYEYETSDPDNVYTPETIVTSPHMSFTKTNVENTTDAISSGYENYLDIVASVGLSDELSADVRSHFVMHFGASSGENSADIYYLAKPRALLKKAPGFYFSAHTADDTPMLVSLDTYERILKDAAEATGQEYLRSAPNKQRMMIRLVEGSGRAEREEMINMLTGIVNTDFASITDTVEMMQSTNNTTGALNYVFITVSVIASLLCFFHLMVSFTSNVTDNAWEYGVLRSIGLSANKLIRAYIYEALALVVAAFLCGTVIGVVIACTLSAQYNLFVEMPFRFDFPWLIFFVLFFLAILVAIVGSYIPAHKLRKREIAFVLRGLA